MKKKELKFYVYILECADGSYYIGFTHDLFTRIKYHYKGEGAAYTRKRLSCALSFEGWSLFFLQNFPSSPFVKCPLGTAQDARDN